MFYYTLIENNGSQVFAYSLTGGNTNRANLKRLPVTLCQEPCPAHFENSLYAFRPIRVREELESSMFNNCRNQSRAVVEKRCEWKQKESWKRALKHKWFKALVEVRRVALGTRMNTRGLPDKQPMRLLHLRSGVGSTLRGALFDQFKRLCMWIAFII